MSNSVIYFGKTNTKRQRFRCLSCKKTFIWNRPYNKKYKEKHWFNLWVKEGYSIRQLSDISGHSEFKLKQIKNYWLSKEPPVLSNYNYQKSKYILFDGTYFHKNGCLAIFMNCEPKDILLYAYIDKESYYNVHPLCVKLKGLGLNPIAITLDGHKLVIKAVLDVWPNVTIQRCLYHIQNQGLMWIRTYPKTEAGKELRVLLTSLTNIRTVQEKDAFLKAYNQWLSKHKMFIKTLPRTSAANTDLKRTMGLVNNALPNMFHYLKDQNIAPTTNLLENLYSQLKHQYRNHRGLTEQHKISYLKWYCYLKNGLK